MAVFVYLIMFAGNGVFLYVVLYPRLKKADSVYVGDGTGQNDLQEEDENENKRLRVIIETCFYELFSFMMIWSHLATMCTDPGFIPFHYRYNTNVLTKPF